MANRIILGAALSLALIFLPSLSSAVPSKTTKKKSTRSEGQKKVTSKTSKTGKNTKATARSRKARAPQADDTAFEPGVKSSEPTKGSLTGIPETKPLMRVTPQRDGRFMLEPLTPPKPGAPVSRPAPQQGSRETPPQSQEPKYNKFEPWNFSELVLSQAKNYCGARYSRGASLEYSSATDCSGFVQYIYRGFKMDLPRSSAEQAQVGKVVTRTMDFSKLLPGDLLFFRRGGRSIGHAGIYLGEGKMIHASNYRNGVIVTDLRQPYYEGTFVVAKRVFEVQYAKK